MERGKGKGRAQSAQPNKLFMQEVDPTYLGLDYTGAYFSLHCSSPIPPSRLIKFLGTDHKILQAIGGGVKLKSANLSIPTPHAPCRNADLAKLMQE